MARKFRFKLSVGRIWALTGLLFLVSFLFPLCVEFSGFRETWMKFEEPDPQPWITGISFCLTSLATCVLLFAAPYTLYRIVHWIFTREVEDG